MILPLRPRRSALYLPASNPRALAKARTLDADIVILDLEDAVAPDHKADARDAAIAAAGEGGWGRRELLVRVNATDTPWHAADVAAVARASGIDGIVLPKVNGPADTRAANEALADAPRGLALWVMIETCAAVGGLPAIARAGRDTRLAGLVMGWNDLTREMRATPGPDRAIFQPFLAMAVAAARAEGLVVLDGVLNAINDAERLDAECRQGLAFGVDGKTLIHPAQIASCNAVFSPDAAALAWAARVVEAFEAPDASGVVAIDGRMVERLHLDEAVRLLAIAAMIQDS